MSPKLLKGVLVKLGEELLGPIPNIIVFQYNPETISRTLSPSSAASEAGVETAVEATTEPFDPTETITMKLELDATDALEQPERHPVAVISGVGDRLAALEMLLYPAADGGLLGLVSGLMGGGADAVPRSSVPVVLFVWGTGRILPVRLTSFNVEEQMVSPTLYPIHATVSVSMRVLTDKALERRKPSPTAAEKIAIAAYRFTRAQKETLAQANLLNSTESVLNMLPF